MPNTSPKHGEIPQIMEGLAAWQVCFSKESEDNTLNI